MVSFQSDFFIYKMASNAFLKVWCVYVVDEGWGIYEGKLRIYSDIIICLWATSEELEIYSKQKSIQIS